MSHLNDDGMIICSVSVVFMTRMLLLLTFSFLFCLSSFFKVGCSLALSEWCSKMLFSMISLTCLRYGSFSWLSLMLTVFRVCIDCCNTLFSYSCNICEEVIAQNQASFLCCRVFVPSITAWNVSLSSVQVCPVSSVQVDIFWESAQTICILICPAWLVVYL